MTPKFKVGDRVRVYSCDSIFDGTVNAFYEVGTILNKKPISTIEYLVQPDCNKNPRACYFEKQIRRLVKKKKSEPKFKVGDHVIFNDKLYVVDKCQNDKCNSGKNIVSYLIISLEDNTATSVSENHLKEPILTEFGQLSKKVGELEKAIFKDYNIVQLRSFVKRMDMDLDKVEKKIDLLNERLKSLEIKFVHYIRHLDLS